VPPAEAGAAVGPPVATAPAAVDVAGEINPGSVMTSNRQLGQNLFPSSQGSTQMLWTGRGRGREMGRRLELRKKKCAVVPC
jgi:hypothetical protein